MRRLTALAALLAICACGPQNVDHGREFVSGGRGTVFTPLPLPAPTSVRAGSGAPGAGYWQQQVDHAIEATFDPETGILTATEVIQYTNNSPHDLPFIWLNLEQNIHRKDSIRSRQKGSTSDHPGMTITRMEVDGQPVSWHDHVTLARVDLEEPIANSGGTIELTIDFSFPIRKGATLRMGRHDAKAGPIWEFAHWFPAPAVYDDVHGWNTLPYIGSGEFYTQFGDYEVSITVPRDHLVFGSGVLQNPDQVLTQSQRDRLAEAALSDETIAILTLDEIGQDDARPEGDGPLTWRFDGRNIRTFAFATSSVWAWDASSIAIADLDGNEHRTLCQAAYPTDVAKYWDRSAEYVRHAIGFYSEWLYPYPWPVMSNIYGVAGGMEYPMIIFCRGRDAQGLFNVTDHEVGHNWFPMLVNNDERRQAWMDEGFNTFTDHYSLENFYGDTPHRPDVPNYDAPSHRNDTVPINVRPDLLQSRRHLSYRKPGWGLRLLRDRILGAERFDRAFRGYVHRWAFKHPRPADFYRSMEDGAKTSSGSSAGGLRSPLPSTSQLQACHSTLWKAASGKRRST